MRICFCGHFTAGGTERAAFLAANELCKKNDIYIINTCDKKPYFYLNKNINIDYMPIGNIIKRNVYFANYLKKNKIDVLITVEAMTGIFSIAAAKIAGCKHIVWEHANYYQTQGSNKIQFIRQLELKLCDAYVVLTKRDKRNFEKHFKIKSRLEYIYNITEKVENAEYNINSKTIVSAGHIRKIKNFSIIPEIGKKVFEKHSDWVWNIYGDGQGDEYDKLVSKIKEYHLENNIKLCGRTDNMENVYNNAAMYVMTSLMEGLPMVLLEAKAHKLPLISFDIETGPDEIIEDGVNGYLVKAYDVEEMAEKIEKLIENQMLRYNFSEEAYRNIERFDTMKITKKWEELINSI